jgi:mono/diheme cytochrome c family protein
MRTNLNTQYSILNSFALAFVFCVSSCYTDTKTPGYEYMPDMYRSPSYETNSSNPNFKDGMTDRQPVAGTIPVGFVPFAYPNTIEGYQAASAEWKIAADMHNPENLTEGKRLYESYCIHCHGAEGNGDGPVVQAGFAPPPSYSKGNSSRGGKMADLTDGKIYHTIMYGLNLMGSHASQLLPDERMKIVMYVHELQKLGAPVDSTATADVAATSAGPVKKVEKKIVKSKKKTN